MSSTGQKTVRKFPPPCWTRDEALVLIEAYRERWHALHRAFLRTPDWDAVAETVTSSCPDVTPPKTSAQCRHKMEKLRQRHRAEKQRASAFPGERFFSTWFYYEAMEAMENGPGSSSEPGNNPDPGQGIQVKPLAVQKFATLAPISTKQRTKPNPNPNFNSGKWRNENNSSSNGKNVNGKNGKKGKRKDGGVAEVVSSIRLLGEGFMKVEKMKMDMAREIEEMRMETEMKRNELMIESQKQIVDAFVQGLVKSRKVKAATMVNL
ncbi:putative transcription factor MYB family [Helianthus annuus]|nr:putative transcription factor MYB family [Helianthus annuus]KAJ0609665.1 putative transcription factor MYB family [Helianthus annuus]KAJ0769714.1 putative transcription factor MYB family [Helianthus annuus]